jgi:hypothetical protein
VSRSAWFGPTVSALRSMWADSFFQRKPVMFGSGVNYDLARSLYRNDSGEYVFGAGFAKPIIDLTVEYMGIPNVSGTSDDAFLNDCLADHWAPKLQEAFRDAIRDSKVYVRFRQPRLDNPLMTEADRMRGRLEILTPEECEIMFDPSDPDLVLRATITHFVEVDQRTPDEVLRGIPPRLVTHEIVEIITPLMYSFFDKNLGDTLDEWQTPNEAGFVPVWPMYNEYASDLGGGQSDLEPVLPFIQAFHECFEQAMAAHRYHASPKVKFKVKDVFNFIKNNWPDAIDPDTGRVKQNAKISFSGREVMFFQTEEDAEFIEAKSVLGDMKTMLEFLIDCIAITAETPRWALLIEQNRVTEQDATVQPFVKKIDRKRIMFQEPLSMICKMALAANGKTPTTPRFTWAPVRLMDLATKGQAIQQLILGFDAAAAHQWLSDRTIVQILATLFEEVSDPDEEMEAAKSNVVVEAPPAPPSPTQAVHPPNGKVSTSAAKNALATTSASAS